jgi:hypothetical protein
MSLFPVAPDNSLFPVPNREMLHPVPKIGNVTQMRPVESLSSTYNRSDIHGVILSHSQKSHARRHERMQQANALDNWTNDLMGRNRR